MPKGRKPPATRPVGRPSKILDAAVRDNLLTAIRAGNYIESAVRYAGISVASYRRWMDRGQSDDPDDAPYAEFRTVVEKARADAEVRYVAIIAKAAERTWQASAWWLERSFPDRWGFKHRVDMGVEATLRVIIEGEASGEQAGAAPT